MATQTNFEQLLTEASAVPTIGWDFSWFDGRATEARPSWNYSRSLLRRIESSKAMLELQPAEASDLRNTLQGRVSAGTMVATESWRPNVELAKVNLAPFDISVLEIDDEAVFRIPVKHLTSSALVIRRRRGGKRLREFSNTVEHFSRNRSDLERTVNLPTS